MPLGGAYHMSKWCVEALNETLAHEVAEFGINVTVIEPAGFATRKGKNPNPLDNGHMAQLNPAYSGLRQRLGQMTSSKPTGDPVAAAQTLLKIVDMEQPPLRVLFGQGFHQMIEQIYTDRLKTWTDGQDLSIAAHGTLDQATANPQA